jgi:membrane fusion protein, multidrug efflux system
MNSTQENLLRVAAVFAATTLSGFVSLQASSGQPESKPLPPVNVETASATRAEQPRFRTITGTIRPVDSARIAARVTGAIIDFPVFLGQRVEKGQILARLSAQEITYQLQQAQGNLDKARRDLAREEKLLADGASTAEVVNDLRDQVRILDAAVEEAKTRVAYTALSAPFTGVVTEKFANEGDLATPGRPLLTILDPNRLRVETHIPEILAESLRPGDRLTIEYGRQHATLEVPVVEIAPVADPASRTLFVKLDLPAGHASRPGQFVRVRIPGPPEPIITIPTAALHQWGQMERVFTVEKGQARLRIVKSGLALDGRTEILAGLEGSETLVLHPPNDLQDAQPVNFPNK